MTMLYGTAVTLRPVTAGDVDRLAEILAAPEVARWWPGYDHDRVRSELIDAADVVVLVVMVDDELVGCVQFNEETNREYRHATIDVFLDPAWHGKGLGTDTVRTVARHLIHDRGHHRLAIDPAADNVKAIRTYERVGFRKVGVLRQYERGADGEWHDGLLMDLLKRDLH